MENQRLYVKFEDGNFAEALLDSSTGLRERITDLDSSESMLLASCARVIFFRNERYSLDVKDPNHDFANDSPNRFGFDRRLIYIRES